MTWFKRKKKPVVIYLGQAVRVECGGQFFYMQLQDVSVDCHRGATATLADLTHFVEVA